MVTSWSLTGRVSQGCLASMSMLSYKRILTFCSDACHAANLQSRLGEAHHNIKRPPKACGVFAVDRPLALHIASCRDSQAMDSKCCGAELQVRANRILPYWHSQQCDNAVASGNVLVCSGESVR